MSSSASFFYDAHHINMLVVGDVMIDRYLQGQVDRISPEAPVPVVRLQHTDNRLGGAANVALNLKALGANPFLCSTVGADTAGEAFMQLLPAAGLPTEGIVRSAQRATTTKTRVIAQHQQLLRIDEEDTFDLSQQESETLLTQIRGLLDNQVIHLILLQDYNKGVLTARLIQEITLEAGKRNIPVAVDPKERNFWAFRQVTLFKPNLREIQQQLDFVVKPELNSLIRAAEVIQARLDNQYTMITLSDKGLFLYGPNLAQIVPTQPRSIVDVCGAGDTVISTAALALALGLPPLEIAILANLAGGQVCEKVGVTPVDKGKLHAEYAHYQKSRE